MKPFAQQTYYELLEVPVTAPMEEIHAAYSRLMELYAPDSIAVYALVDPDQVDLLRARMTEAMEILTDADLRVEYDKDLGLPARLGGAAGVAAAASGLDVVARAAEALVSAVGAPAIAQPEARNGAVAHAEAPAAGQGVSVASVAGQETPAPVAPAAGQGPRSPEVQAAEMVPAVASQETPESASAEEAPALSGPEAFRASFVSGYSLSYVTSSLQSAPFMGGAVDVSPAMARAQAAAQDAETSRIRSNVTAQVPVSETTVAASPQVESVAGLVVDATVAPVITESVSTMAPVVVAPASQGAASPGTAVASSESATESTPVVVSSESVGTATPVSALAPASLESVGAAASVAASSESVGTATPDAPSPEPVGTATLVVASPAEPVITATPVVASPEPAPVAEAPPVPVPEAPVPEAPSTALVVATPPARASTPVQGGPAPSRSSTSGGGSEQGRPSSRYSPGRKLGEAQVLAQDAAIATAEAAMAQVAARVREVRPRIPDIPADAEFNGELLRRVRETRGYTLQQVADRTRISSRHLENVEADRYTALPAQVYLRGIIMNLARDLGLDPLQVSRSYLALASEKSGKK